MRITGFIVSAAAAFFISGAYVLKNIYDMKKLKNSIYLKYGGREK